MNKSGAPVDESKSNNSYRFISSNIEEDTDEQLIYDMANSNLNSSDSSSQSSSSVAKMIQSTKNLFQIEAKYLNADNEMIRMFGAKIVQAEKTSNNNNNNNSRYRNSNNNNQRTSKLLFKQNTIVARKPTWPSFSRHGKDYL